MNGIRQHLARRFTTLVAISLAFTLAAAVMVTPSSAFATTSTTAATRLAQSQTASQASTAKGGIPAMCNALDTRAKLNSRACNPSRYAEVDFKLADAECAKLAAERGFGDAATAAGSAVALAKPMSWAGVAIIGTISFAGQYLWCAFAK